MNREKLVGLCFTVVVLAFTLNSCNDDDSNDSSMSSSTTSSTSVSLDVSPNSLQLSGDAGATATFTITTNSRWSVKGLPSWAQISSRQGNGSATITITTTSANISEEERSASLSVEAGGTVEAGGKISFVKISQSPVKIADNAVYIHDELIMSDGYCAYLILGKDLTQYAGLALPVAKYETLTEEEILSAIQKGNHNDAKNENNNCVWSSRNPNTEYVICIAGLDANGDIGPLTTRRIVTKRSNDLSNATIREIIADTNQWRVHVSMQAECDHFFLLSFNNNDAVQLAEFPSIYLVMLAKSFISSNPTSYHTEGGFYSKSRTSSDYAQFVYTWGVNKSGEFSGTISSEYRNLNSSSRLMAPRRQNTDFGQDTGIAISTLDSFLQR